MFVLGKDVFPFAVESNITNNCQYEESVRVSDNSVCIAKTTFSSSNYIVCITRNMVA